MGLAGSDRGLAGPRFPVGYLPLIAPDEGRNAEVAREMKDSGAWLVPTYNGLDYLDKPAFYFKAVAFSLAAFGNNETAARIPSRLLGWHWRSWPSPSAGKFTEPAAACWRRLLSSPRRFM